MKLTNPVAGEGDIVPIGKQGIEGVEFAVGSMAIAGRGVDLQADTRLPRPRAQCTADDRPKRPRLDGFARQHAGLIHPFDVPVERAMGAGKPKADDIASLIPADTRKARSVLRETRVIRSNAGGCQHLAFDAKAAIGEMVAAHVVERP